MNSKRKQLSQIPILKFLSSVKITVICLSLLFILTLWGTIAQIDLGLYLAQEQFFNSLYFIAGGFLPFPGARLVLWVLFINLVCVSITRFVYRWSHVGITVIHAGLLLFLVSAFVTFHFSKETNVTLREGEGTNVSVSYHDWELSVWEDKASTLGEKEVAAYIIKPGFVGKELNFDNKGFTVSVKSFFSNASAYVSRLEGESSYLNGSGIQSLTAKALEKDFEKNIPGGIFDIKQGGIPQVKILLYGAENQPTPVNIGGKIYNFQLRRERSVLPFIIKLNDFRMEKHPNTEIARSYQSLVELTTKTVPREVLISMNNPLRFKDFTLYQASYALDAAGREYSTLATVQNSGRVLPYVASFVTVLGLFIHLLALVFTKRKKA